MRQASAKYAARAVNSERIQGVDSVMTSPVRPRAFPFGLVLMTVGILAYKAVRMSLEIAGSLALAGQFVLLDLALMGLLLSLALVAAMRWQRKTRLGIKLVLLLAVLYYAIHSFVLLELNEYMSLFDLFRYLPEWGVVWSFMGPLAVLLVIALLLALGVESRLSRDQHRLGAGLALALLVIGIGFMAEAPANIRKYSLLQAAAWAEEILPGQPASTYTASQRRFYTAMAPHAPEFMEPPPNIILLVVESLSSINSLRTSGVRDLLPGFDRLSTQGVLFRNFFANHAASEGGLIALLSGVPPLHYPTASPLMFDEFAPQPTVISAYREQGYFTEFLTNADLSFIGLDRYINGVRLDSAAGRDEVPDFSEAERFVQDAPSDRLLYQEALRRIAQRREGQQPWIMIIATVSTHLPYTHPEGGEDTPEAVWDWSMDRLYEFHDALMETGFYRDGLLLITGDHRQMRPLSMTETERYGDSAKARVPLLVLGRGMEAGRIDDRYFQQADLLRYLARIDQPARPLSPNPVWVERYNRMYGKVESINRFSVFDSADGGMREFPVEVLGADLTWPDAKPEGYRQIEARVHAQRSAHQFGRNGAGLGCKASRAPPDAPASHARGLRLVRRASADLLSPAGIEQKPDSGTLVSGLDADAALEGLAPGQALWFTGFLEVAEAGTYWFRALPDTSLCLSIGARLLIDQNAGQALMQAPVQLEAGAHAIDLRYFPETSGHAPGLEWVRPGSLRWHWEGVPDQAFRPTRPPRVETGTELDHRNES